MDPDLDMPLWFSSFFNNSFFDSHSDGIYGILSSLKFFEGSFEKLEAHKTPPPLNDSTQVPFPKCFNLKNLIEKNYQKLKIYK